jgi:hypothetical protein
MEKVYNKTFRNGITRYNACVGENGIFDGKYFLGYDLSVKVLCKTLIKDTTEIDQLIFPILFNARHAIELYIKDALYNIFKINESIDFIKDMDIDVDKLQSTHNLYNLWQMFENNAMKLDRRIQEYIDYQKEYISDYFEIDLSGETFRYQYTKENAIHLSKTPLINIIHFYERYNELSQNMHKLIRFIDQVNHEYHIYPYTKTLSPNDLLVISKRLGDISSWKENAFKEIKEAIKTEYSIGSKELCNAVNIIKETPEYSRFIGIENYIFHISKEKILEVIKIVSESDDNYKEDFEKFENFTTDEVLSIRVLTSGNDITTAKEYYSYFNSFKNTFSKDTAIDGIISKDEFLLLKRIRETLKRFSILNLTR